MHSYNLRICSRWSIQRHPSKENHHLWVTIDRALRANRLCWGEKPDSIRSISWGSLISCNCIPFYAVLKLGFYWIPPASENNICRLNCSPTCLSSKELGQAYYLTPISVIESELLITFGANARGLRDSICLRVARTVSSWIGLLKHSRHEHGSIQYTPAAKHSQYLHGKVWKAK